MKTTPVQLTKTEAAHLAYLLTRNQEDGVYPAPEGHYWQRMARIKAKLHAAIDLLVKQEKC